MFPEIEARAIPPKPVPICLPEVSDLEDRSEERVGRTTKDEEDDYAVVTGWGLVTEGKRVEKSKHIFYYRQARVTLHTICKTCCLFVFVGKEYDNFEDLRHHWYKRKFFY